MARKTINTISAGADPMYRIDEDGSDFLICTLNDDGTVASEVRLMRSVAPTIGRFLVEMGNVPR